MKQGLRFSCILTLHYEPINALALCLYDPSSFDDLPAGLL
jgi:hypothetical protein